MEVSKDVLQEIFDKGQAATATIDTPDGGKLAILPNDYRAHVIAPEEKRLLRIRQSPGFYDLASFNGYIDRYKGDGTRIFAVPGHIADSGEGSVRAIFDYHKPGTPDYAAHQAAYVPRYSEEWVRWTKARPMHQAEFAEFIEENRRDIREPDAALLLDIVTKFKATKKSDYDSLVHQPDGSVMVAYSDKVQQAGPGVAVPTELRLGIPVFFKGTVYEVPVFMRYRLAEGKLTFVVKVDRADYIEQAAFDEITKAVSEATGIEVYLGKLS